MEPLIVMERMTHNLRQLQENQFLWGALESCNVHDESKIRVHEHF